MFITILIATWTILGILLMGNMDYIFTKDIKFWKRLILIVLCGPVVWWFALLYFIAASIVGCFIRISDKIKRWMVQ